MVNTYTISEEAAVKIEAFRKHDLLLSGEPSYDRITRLVAKTMNAPVVMLTFESMERTWVKSAYGASERQYSTLEFNSHAGLETSEGVHVGRLSVKHCGVLDARQQTVLQEMADMAIDFMEMQLSAKLAYAQQKQLFHIAAHDLKNPLTTIPVRADLIKLKKNDPDVVDRMCDQIKNAGLMMTRTIDELLTAATMEDGKFDLFTLKLDFAEIVMQLVESNEALAVHKNQRIELLVNKRPMVIADEQRLIEIVDNLINNAIKYSPKGELIRVTVDEREGRAIIKVQDNGPGLSEDDKSNMFRPYAKLSAHPTGNENSTGLGLSIVRQLVEAHYGKVWAESDGKGHGTAFYAALPSC